MFTLKRCHRQADSVGLHHLLDGVTNPEYKLLHFIQLTKFFSNEAKAVYLTDLGTNSYGKEQIIY